MPIIMETLVDLNVTQQQYQHFDSQRHDKGSEVLRVGFCVKSSNYQGDSAVESGGSTSDNIDIREERVSDPGYCIRAATVTGKVCLINVYKSDVVGKPSVSKQKKDEGKCGLQWNIPHSLSAGPDDDVSRATPVKRVFSFVIHPDTYRMAETNAEFWQMVSMLAIDGLQQKFSIRIDSTSVHIPQLQNVSSSDSSLISKSPSVDGTHDNKMQVLTSEGASLVKAPTRSNCKLQKGVNNILSPRYVIAKDAAANEIVITVDMPLANKVSSDDVTIRENQLILLTHEPTVYNLNIKLPEAVDTDSKHVQFDESAKQLCVRLSLLPCAVVENIDEQWLDVSESMLEETTGIAVEETYLKVKNVGIEEPSSETGSSASTSSDLSCVIPGSSMQYHLPEFSTHVEPSSVTYIFHVAQVKPESVSFNVTADNRCHVQMTSYDADNSSFIHFSCCIMFSAECRIMKSSCSVDVSDFNVVLVIGKDPLCTVNWDCYWIGTTFESMEKQDFLTSATLIKALNQIDEDNRQLTAEGGNSNTDEKEWDPDVDVTEMDKEKLVIQLENSKKSGTEADEAAVASDIIVVHTKGCPRLHSILKQRTISESSDDSRRISFSNSDRQTSLASDFASESEDGSLDCALFSSSLPSVCSISGHPFLKKSVSFNEHVDRALFQAHQSVSSMHSVLKNRRRRARKRDQRAEARSQRRRCHSSGSISLDDSGDELLQQNDSATAGGSMAGGDGRSAASIAMSKTVAALQLEQSSKSVSTKSGNSENQNIQSAGRKKSSGVSRKVMKPSAADESDKCSIKCDAVKYSGNDQPKFDAEVNAELESVMTTSDYSGKPRSIMTKSGRNAINSSGAFRTSGSDFYHRDYMTLCEENCFVSDEFDSTVLSVDTALCDDHGPNENGAVAVDAVNQLVKPMGDQHIVKFKAGLDSGGGCSQL